MVFLKALCLPLTTKHGAFSAPAFSSDFKEAKLAQEKKNKKSGECVFEQKVILVASEKVPRDYIKRLQQQLIDFLSV